MQSIFPILRYDDARGAIRWLCDAFGFVEAFSVPPAGPFVRHAQLRLGTNIVMVGSVRPDDGLRSPGGGEATQGLCAHVADVDAHHERALAAGAHIASAPKDTDFGSREYHARDPEGHPWTFTSYHPFSGEALVRAFYRDIWDRHDASRVPTLLHEDFAFRGSLGSERRGHAEFIAYVDSVHAALGDYRCVLEELVSDGDRAFARMLFTGTHRGEFLGFAPTGKTVSWAGAALFTFREGKIASLWVLGDVHGLRERLAANAAG